MGHPGVNDNIWHGVKGFSHKKKYRSNNSSVLTIKEVPKN